MKASDPRFRATRRGFLMAAVVAPVAGYAAAAAAQAACVNPDALSSGQKAMRNSLGFRLVSEDPKRRCGGCAFYTATEGACGKCTLLSNGPVPAEGRCDSWAARK